MLWNLLNYCLVNVCIQKKAFSYFVLLGEITGIYLFSIPLQSCSIESKLPFKNFLKRVHHRYYRRHYRRHKIYPTQEPPTYHLYCRPYDIPCLDHPEFYVEDLNSPYGKKKLIYMKLGTSTLRWNWNHLIKN